MLSGSIATRGVFGCLFFVGAFFCLVCRAESPWDEPMFSVEAAVLTKAAADRPVPEDADCEILLAEKTFRIDEEGRWQTTERTVIRCITKAAAEEWGVLTEVWSPWYQQRPQLRARVISRDGDEYQLDPKRTSESNLGETLPGIFRDQRVIQAPLPAVRQGCLIEQEVILQGTKPFFAEGTIGRMEFQPLWPTRKIRLMVDAPERIPITFQTRGVDLGPKETVKDARRITVYETDEVKWPVDFTPLLPADKAGSARVAFTTGRSWGEVAAGYGKMLEGNLDGSAVKKLAEETVGKESSRERRVEKLLRKAQQLVRYTDVEFGMSSIVPAPPAETIERSYGDCKDQSALLVAMLRAVGQEAYVALVNTQYGNDADEKLPGLNTFNHMIVYIPGQTPMWVDPTSEYTRIGALPAGDQRRRALIIAPHTEQLVRTPASGSQENVYRQTCRIELADWGGAKMLQTIEGTGTIDEELRQSYGDSDPASLRETWKDHAKDVMRASSLDVLEYPDPHDFSVPFRIRTVVTGAAALGLTDSTDASAAVSASGIVERLPYYFRWGAWEDEEDSKDEKQAVASKPQRTDPFWIPGLHRSEFEYVIVPPCGYRCAEVPESVEEKFGSVSMSRHYEIEESGTVRVRHTLDTGSGQLSPEEAKLLRAAVERLQGDDEAGSSEQLITFRHVGYQHLAEGRVAEALAEYGRCAAECPASAPVQARLAAALNDAGFGDAARRMARRAVEMDGKCSYTHQILGSVLTYDLFGRQYEDGFDRQAAMEAFKRSIELNPENIDSHVRLGNLLERNSLGHRFGTGADFQGAAEHFRKAAELSPGNVNGLDDSLMYLHWFSGDQKAAREYAEKNDQTYVGNAVLLALIAVADGAEKAVQKSSTFDGGPVERRQSLAHAAELLNATRYYPQAAVLLRQAAAPGTALPHWDAWCRLRDRMRRHEEIALADGDPRGVVQRLLACLLWRRRNQIDLKPFLAASTQDVVERFTDLNRVNSLLEAGRREARLFDGPIQWRADLVSLINFQAEGSDDTCHRVEAQCVFLPDTTWYVVKESGQYRVLDPGEDRSRLGEIALLRLDKNDPEGARQLLEWAVKDRKTAGRWSDLFNPFNHPPFAHIWARKNSDPATVRLAAASLAARGPRVIEILEKSRESADDATKFQIDRTLVTSYLHANQPDRALEIIESILARQPRVADGYQMKHAALMGMGRFEDARRAAEAVLEKFPDAGWALDLRAETAAVGGNLVDAAAYWQKAQGLANAPVSLPWRLAWCRLDEPPVPDNALQNALKASQSLKVPNRTALFVLAALRAEAGEIAEGREALMQCLDTWDPAVPAGCEWYLVGRLAERCQLPEVAIAAYKKVSCGGGYWSTVIGHRTQKRLESLVPGPGGPK